MIPLVGEEGGNSSSSTGGIVVGELCKQKEVKPVVLLVISVDLEVLLECLVCAFGLSITLRMVS